jgi:CubicO group peptidase (beta-lactamase class C family)
MKFFQTLSRAALLLCLPALALSQGTPTPSPTRTPSSTPTATPTATSTATSTSTPQTDYSKAIKDLEDYIPDQMDRHHVKGLSIALVDGDKVVWLGGFGYANQEKQVKADGDTLYHLGAVSKIFTAAEILLLAHNGKLGLERPVQKYIPGFSINSRFKDAKPITVKSLLANHSGLPGFYLKGLWVDHPESLSDFVEDLKSDYLVAPPQTLYKYSYVDYDLLGRIVELKRKKPFAQALRGDLFEPLGMDSSSFDDSSDKDPQLAQGYRHGDPVALAHMRDTPAAGMVSSARDLARFLQFILGGGAPGDSKPLGQKALETMFKPAYPGLPLDFGHEVGLGWQLSGIDVPGAQDVSWHDGEYPPYNAQVVALHREGLGMVLLSNCAEGDDLQGDVTERALKLMLAAKYGIPEDLKKKEIKMPKTITVAPEDLDKDTGYYSALGQLMKITRKDGHLGAEWDGHDLDLLPVAPDTFVPHITFIIFPIDLPQFPLTFSRVGDQPMAVLGGLTFPVPLESIQPVAIPEAWKAREGDYELENPDGVFTFTRIHLEEKEGFLTVDLKVSFPAFDIKDREFKVALLPLSDEEAVIPGLFYGDGGTLRVESDEKGEKVFYSGYWFRKKPGEGTPVAPAPKPAAGN